MLNEENKINIAMFSDSFFPTMGGREKVIDYSMRELIKDNNAFLCAPKIKNKKYAEFSDSNLPYKVYRCNSIKIFNESYLAIFNRKFRKEVEKLKFDIIHCQTKYALLNYAFKLRKKFNVPVVTSVHTNYLYIYTKQMPKFIRNIALKYVVKQMNKCDKVIAVSNYMKNQIISLGVKSDIVVIKNGTNFKETELFDKNYIRNYYNIDDDRLMSFITRANYAYREKYLLGAVFRADGSSRNAEGRVAMPESLECLRVLPTSMASPFWTRDISGL